MKEFIKKTLNFYSLSNVSLIMVFKSRRIWWARHEASSGEKREVHIILNQKSEEKRPLGCRRHIMEPNSKYINKEIFLSYEGVKRHKNSV